MKKRLCLFNFTWLHSCYLDHWTFDYSDRLLCYYIVCLANVLRVMLMCCIPYQCVV